MIKEYRFRNLDYIISYPEGYVDGKRYPIIFTLPAQAREAEIYRLSNRE